jgi:hypothetical protein
VSVRTCISICIYIVFKKMNKAGCWQRISICNGTGMSTLRRVAIAARKIKIDPEQKKGLVLVVVEPNSARRRNEWSCLLSPGRSKETRR